MHTLPKINPMRDDRQLVALPTADGIVRPNLGDQHIGKAFGDNSQYVLSEGANQFLTPVDGEDQRANTLDIGAGKGNIGKHRIELRIGKQLVVVDRSGGRGTGARHGNR